MKDVTVSASTASAGDFGLTGALTINNLKYNGVASGFDRLDWNSAVDLNGDGEIEVLNPGAKLPTPIDLTINFPSTFHFEVGGSITGNGGTGSDLLVAGPITIGGSTNFAVARWTLDVDTDSNGSVDLLNATLDSIALDTGANSVSLIIDNVIELSLSGTMGLAYIKPVGETEARYTALTMGDVSITTDNVIADFGLSGTLTVDNLRYNDGAAGYDRLDWTRAFDVNGNNIYEELNPGALLPLPIDLTIDLPGTEHFLIAGSISSDPPGTPLLTAGTITLTGSAKFALTRWTVDVDTDGNGTEDLLGAQFDSIALDVSDVNLSVTDLATLTVDSGYLGLAYLTASGDTNIRYAALTMSDVVVSASTATATDFGLSGTLEIDHFEYNYAADGFERLDWTKGVDVNDDGIAGILDPGQLLTTPVGPDTGLSRD